MTIVALYIVTVIHTIIVALNATAIIILPFETAWYISVPLVTYLVGATFGKCPLTTAENCLRRRLDLEEIDSFIEHYLWSKSR